MKKIVVNKIKGNKIRNILSFGFTYSYDGTKHSFTNTGFSSDELNYTLYNFTSKYIEVYLETNGETSGYIVDPGSTKELQLDSGSQITSILGQATFAWTANDWYEFQRYIVLTNGPIKGKVLSPFIGEKSVGEPCRNIFASKVTEQGCVDRYSGDVLLGGMYDNYRTSDKIPVQPGEVVIATGVLGDKQYPCRIFAFTNADLLVKDVTTGYLEIPQDVTYIRFSCNLGTDYSSYENVNYQVEYGISFTEYIEPYEGYRTSIRSGSEVFSVTTNNALDLYDTVEIIEHKAITSQIEEEPYEAEFVSSPLGNIEFLAEEGMEFLTCITPVLDVTIYYEYDGVIFKSPTDLGNTNKIYWDKDSQAYLIDNEEGTVITSQLEKVHLNIPTEEVESDG